LFAHKEYGITPDILCLGKALGGGMPLGAFISSKSKMMKLKSDPILGHITTFGGNPVSCAAGLAAFQVLKSSNWLIDVKRRGELIKEVLTSHPKVCEVRGTGLLLSVILETEDFKNLVYKKLIERKIITNFFLFNNEALRITPPLCITANEIDYFNSNFIQVLNQL
jgi:acetylornithine/succinyldiaminopimelate/putrescine aminotransferase